MKYGQHSSLYDPAAFTRRSVFEGFEAPREEEPSMPILHAQEAPVEPPPIPSAPMSFAATPTRRPIVHQPEEALIEEDENTSSEEPMPKIDGAAKAARMNAKLTAEDRSARAKKGHATRRALKLGLPVERPGALRPRCSCGAVLRKDSKSDQCYRCRNGQKPRARKTVTKAPHEERIDADSMRDYLADTFPATFIPPATEKPKAPQPEAPRSPVLPPVSDLPSEYLAECIEEGKRRIAATESIARALRSAA